MSFKTVAAYFCLIAAATVIQVTQSFPSSEQDSRFNVSEDASWFLEQPEFQNFLQSLPSSRSGRTLLEPEPELPECGGKFLTLNQLHPRLQEGELLGLRFIWTIEVAGEPHSVERVLQSAPGLSPALRATLTQ